MEVGESSQEVRLIFYSEKAAEDLASIHTYTSQAWGEDQAERTLDLIEAEVLRLAEGRATGQQLEDFPSLHRWMARWPGAHYSHWIIYQSKPKTLTVVRILHSSMNLPDHVG